MKVILITGGTSGLGLASAEAFIQTNLTVVLSARNESKKADTLKYLEKYPNAKIYCGIMDLCDLSSVHAFYEWFCTLNLSLDVLLLNAGIALVPPTFYSGIESHFLVNHLSQFYLTSLLLKKFNMERIVIVASKGESMITTSPDWSKIAIIDYGQSMNASFKQYSYSKLANVAYCMELSKRFPKIRVNVVHPGSVSTNIIEKSAYSKTFIGSLMIKIWKLFSMSPEKGSTVQVYACTSPDIIDKNISGKYFGPGCIELSINPVITDDVCKSLWALSEQLITD